MRKSGKAQKWAARSDRLSVALRENLKRRKAQARARGSAKELSNETASPDEGLTVEGPDFRRNRGSD